ncbi:uncharacterized protein LOC132554435 [Ylistrum balloti]|uniref:uncharacterized protein LOC132554435 n=1 Tax=Ylistrum balloti TaxID=509963 RepID=UPI002905C296|nr:uncharacterized protein LOC132554435 [Ylistrum balloti]
MNVVCSLLAVCLFVVLCDSCCVPKQWEALEGIVTGIDEHGRDNLEEGTVLVAYDAISQRFAADYKVYYGEKHYGGKIILDFARERQYIISKGKCEIAILKDPFRESCIPGEIKPYVYTIGVGENIMELKSYQVDYAGIKASISVTGNCVPVGEVLSGQVNGMNFLETIGYTNLTVGIRDESVFEPPAICMGSLAQRMILGKLRDPIVSLRKHAILGA